MLNLLFVALFAIFLLLALYVFNFIMSVKKNDLLKVGAFESGFVSVGKIQNSFSIHFFVMMLMFVIFDLEIVMFLGLLISDMSSLVSFFMLMLFIFGGFYMEWWYGKLVWVV
uniref:NADH-ubiquinone oxidoreductase chain 3 n=1 Tax=Cylicostephanus minutus TaxID=71467 RepID=A0A1X9ZFP6_9BILA|nr:NADH dehydrogenase subunit 3 [Cylicostephanus minutus]ARS44141.1 NADH dehydrogenase subunit 3 [Cylicostephanus minutus]QZH43800.1 NADH dehydrogenase subunit 3 [Cylicostephanus minutus]QZH43812.1 NADH dehydrogenase subunit 3 [Cylicostephanus minutus]